MRWWVETWMLMVLGLLVLMIGTGPGFPHDKWADGSPVPPWVKAACCGPADAHELRPDQVHEGKDGIHIDGYPDLIPYSEVLPSQDGSIWAFYRQIPTTDGSVQFSKIYCFFYSGSI